MNRKSKRGSAPYYNRQNTIFDIITDELKHASKYNYLLTLNSTENDLSMNGSSMRLNTTNTDNCNINKTNSSNSKTTRTTNSTTSATNTNTSNFDPNDWVSILHY